METTLSITEKIKQLQELNKLLKDKTISQAEYDLLKQGLLNTKVETTSIPSADLPNKKAIKPENIISTEVQPASFKHKDFNERSAKTANVTHKRKHNSKMDDVYLALKISLVVIVVTIVVVILLPKDSTPTNTSSNNISSSTNNTPLNNSIRSSKTVKVSEKISGRYFYNNENGLSTSIHFEPSQEGLSFGAMTLAQTGCNFVYTYDIQDNSINLKFYQSDCGRTSSSQLLQYDEMGDYIRLYLNGELFIFR